MHIVAMAEDVKTVPDEPGAPVPKGTIDPELLDLANIKLARTKLRIGALTSAGVMFLALFFVIKLNPDRRFSGEPEVARRVTVADIAAGKVGKDAHVIVDAEPLMSHAVRSSTQKGTLGMRLVPARGSAQKLWLVMPGDGWGDAGTLGYVGRLRPLADLPFADSITSFLAAHPRPLFAPAAAVRTGFASSKVTTVAGDVITLRDSDRVGFDRIDLAAANVTCTYNERHKDAVACAKALSDAGIAIIPTATPVQGREQATFAVTGPDAVATSRVKLDTAKLFGAYVDPVTQHYETTWSKLKSSPPSAFTVASAVDATTVPETEIDLVGLYVSREIPSGAFALIAGERPQDYWYVLPVTIVVGLIALLFAWALVRAIKRDLLPVRA
jgi:hypothetical protein